MLRNHAIHVFIAFTGIVCGIDLDEAILKDMITPGSDKCINDGSTIISYTHTPSPSTWDSNNAYREKKNFLAQMTHSDSDPNKSWTVRFGKGGTIYSMRSGYGEAIPPQTKAFSPWVDEIKQSVAVDLSQNNCLIPSQCYFVHQAGAYFKDTDYLNEPFYSPNVAKHCEGNTCIFATWGQIASIPTIFKSDVLYVHQYRNCGNGVLEYTQMFNGHIGGQSAYLNIPWAGVRGSNLPDLYFSEDDFSMAPVVKEVNIPYWGTKDTYLVTLPETGGYTTFAQDVTKHGDSAAALSYVHGVCNEYSDTENKYFRAPSRLRVGRSRRDFTVFTVNGRMKFKPEQTFVHRQFLVNDSLGNISAQAKELYDDAVGSVLSPSDFEGRILGVYTLKLGTFGVAVASDKDGTSTTCSKGTIVSNGSTVPSNINMLPFFSIKCGNLSYFGPDRYHFAPDPDADGMIRSYVCEGQSKEVVPELKLLGFFIPSDDFRSVENAVYDPSFCDEPPTSAPTTSPTRSPTTNPTRSPSTYPSSNPTSLTNSPSMYPSLNPTSLKCTGLGKKDCKKQKEVCKYSTKKKIWGTCKAKKTTYERDCVRYNSRRLCDSVDNEGLCLWNNGICSHACDDLAKKQCKKLKFLSTKKKICAMSRIKNPCHGCHPKTKC